MTTFRTCVLAACGLCLAASPLSASSLSEYRGFHLDEGLAGVSKQAGASPADANILHLRPALIQELTWQSRPGDSVGQIVFGFYGGELFRMVVGYDRDNTEGMAAPDKIDAIFAECGPATDAAAEIPLSSIYDDNEIVKILARWEGPNWSFNLVRSKYQSAFFLVALSTRLTTLAREAVVEACRLDREEGPQRARPQERPARIQPPPAGESKA